MTTPWSAALLAIAALAAVQARAARGASLQDVQERCQRRGRPDQCAAMTAAGPTIAFISATVVAAAAVVATLLAFQGVDVATAGIRAVAGWIVIVWLALVVVPVLAVRLAGAWVVVATWPFWRPVVGVVTPAVEWIAPLRAGVGEQLETQPVSLMPADLAATLSADELVDVVAWMETLRSTQ